MHRPLPARLLLMCILLILCPRNAPLAIAAPPERLVHWSIEAADPFSDWNQRDKPADFKPEVQRGEIIRLTLRGNPIAGWHTYPINKSAAGNSPAQMSKVTVKSKYFALLPRSIAESEPELVDEGPIGKQYEYAGPFTFSFDVVLRPEAPVKQSIVLEIDINQLVCKEQCVQERTTLNLPLYVNDRDSLPLDADVMKLLKDSDEAEKRIEKTATAPSGPFNWQDLDIVESEQTIGGASKGEGLWSTILKAIVAGFISLVTPCVFPMIPVTVAIFLKRSEAKGHRTLTLAAVYCGTIVIVMAAGGIALVSVLQTISQHWITNLFLTGVFVFFALSLLGMYEIQLPSGLANLTGSKEGQSGLLGIVFMALTFSIISFACVGPIYGGFITLEAATESRGWLNRIAGPLAFSLAFASPFFVLALFPTLIKAMPKSGSWMNSVKVVMGFLELAAAFKFVRAAEVNLLQRSEYFTFDFCLGAYIALTVACGLYLMNVYRLPHDHGAPDSIGVPRLIFSLTFLTIGLYLLPGLFKDEKQKSQKPHGVVYDWVRAFLLPDDPSDWESNLATALAQAEKEKKPLFIDFTGVGCNNCKLNEDSIFAQPKIERQFRDFVTVRLFTGQVPDGIPQVPDGPGAEALRNEKMKNYALPYYVVLMPAGGKTLKKIAFYEKGKIGSADEFADFLTKSLEAAKY